jgi:hypothetical protein
MTSRAQKLAGRIAVAILLVMLAASSAFAVAVAQPATAGPALAEPSEKQPPQTKEAPEGNEDAEDTDAEEADEADGAPSPANLDRIVAALAAAGITTTAEELAALAGGVGVGGAVRVLRFAEASGKTPAEIVALFDSGKGWGVIARELALDVNSGIGSVMGQGAGQDRAAKAADRAARAAEKASRAADRAERKAERAGTGN